MTSGAGSGHRDVAIYQGCQTLAKELDGLALELQRYATSSFEAEDVDFPNHFRDRAKALNDQVDRTTDTSRVHGLIVKKNALGHQLQQAMKSHRHYREGQVRRDLQNVWPDMMESDVEDIVRHDPYINVYQLALGSSRRIGADEVKDAVYARSQAIQKIEQDMSLLAELFQGLHQTVVGQDAPVEHMEKHGERAKEDAKRGTSEVQAAVASARAARKKWWYAGTFWLLGHQQHVALADAGVTALIVFLILAAMGVALVVFRRQISSSKI